MVSLMTLFTSYDTDLSIKDIRWWKKLCCILLQLSWPNEYNDAIGNVIGTTWCLCKWQQCQMTENSCCISFWSSWTNTCSGGFDDTIIFMWYQCHVQPCFNHLDLTKKMVPLTMPTVSCGAHTSTSSITGPKESCNTLFQLSSPSKKWWHW